MNKYKPTELFVLELVVALVGAVVLTALMVEPLAEAAVGLARALWPR